MDEQEQAGDEKPAAALPPSFEDSFKEPRRWEIKLTGAVIDSVLANTGVDLVPDDLDYQAVVELVQSHKRLGGVLFQCVRKQAEQNGVDHDSFFEGFDGAAYARGWGALVDAIRFFIQAINPGRAEAFAAFIEAAMKVKAAEAKTQIALLQSQSTDKALNDAIAKIGSKLQGQLTRGLASSAENLPQLLGELTHETTR